MNAHVLCTHFFFTRNTMENICEKIEMKDEGKMRVPRA